MQAPIYRTVITCITATVISGASAQTVPAHTSKSETLSPIPPTAEYLKKQAKSRESRGNTRLEAGPLADFYELVAQHPSKEKSDAKPSAMNVDIRHKEIVKQDKETAGLNAAQRN